MHSKVAAFIKKSPNQLILPIKIGKNLKSLLVELAKKKNNKTGIRKNLKLQKIKLYINK